MASPRSTRPATEHACSIHRSLDLLGEKWSLLIIRNALRGQSRFSEFRDELGIPSDVLTARLGTLVEAGVLERRSYREEGARERFSYHLTERGRSLKLVLIALQQWSDEYNPFPGGVVSVVQEVGTGRHASLALVSDDGDLLDEAAVEIARGPAARTW
ncbi:MULTISPECIES: winged helix-turn-helix transcriptional regulator [Subtercola]|uniref:Transcriptional regulator n=1 Tax=Subtercola vilae TaxID=2056433 RepID=A0A4T2CAB0_9MICO|nr:MULTISPECIES: helix-turn-helix domain-containing protein [Subtercola]MEA9984570.1 helix-turn-helix domain-containing protein [Subtercola sp. RTI3]TIH39368.1 transcriptional regulator [Subtercola vilae]